MKKNKKILFTSLIASTVSIPLVSTAVSLTSCSSEGKSYYLDEDIKEFIKGDTLEFPEGTISFESSIASTHGLVENVKYIIFPSSIKKVSLAPGFFENLESIWWGKNGQYVNKDVHLDNLTIDLSSNISYLFIPDTKNIDIRISNKFSNDSSNPQEPNVQKTLTKIWTDPNDTTGLNANLTCDLSHLKPESLTFYLASTMIKKVKLPSNYTSFRDIVFTIPLNNKQDPLIIPKDATEEQLKKINFNDVKYSNKSEYQHLFFSLAFKENSAFTLSNPLFMDDLFPNWSYKEFNNYKIDFSNCTQITEQSYKAFWEQWVKGKWSKLELTGNHINDHIIPPNHLKDTCSNETMCNQFQIK